jgi:hypothetical protein
MAVFVRLLLLGIFIAAGAFPGIIPAVLLPASIGSVRVLIGIAGFAAGGVAGWWLCEAVIHVVPAAVRWTVASLAARAPVSVQPYFRRTPDREWRRVLVLATMVCTVVALIVGVR